METENTKQIILSPREERKRIIFKEFIQRLVTAYSEFYTWKFLRNSIKNNNISSKNINFFNTTIISLAFSSTFELAKITETKNIIDEKGNIPISIFYLMEYILSDYNEREIIKKLQSFRNKVLAHIDLKTFLDLDNYLKELNLKYGEIEILFEKVISTANSIKGIFFYPQGLIKHFQSIKELCEEDVRVLIECLDKNNSL